MPDIIAPAIHAYLRPPHAEGFADGVRNRRKGAMYSWRVNNSDWCGGMNGNDPRHKIWNRPYAEGKNLMFATLRPLLPTANMSITDWIRESGTWKARSIGGRTFLVAVKADGSNSQTISVSNMNVNGGLYCEFIVAAPSVGNDASVEIELVDSRNERIWKVILPTHGNKQAQFFFRRNRGNPIAREVDSMQDATGRSADSVRRFRVTLTHVWGALYFEKDGQQIGILSDRVDLTAPVGRLRIKFVGVAGAVYAKDITWETAAIVRPIRGAAPGAKRNPNFNTFAPNIKTTASDGVTTGFVNIGQVGGSRTEYVPWVKLTGGGNSSPVLFGVSLYSVDEKYTPPAQSIILPGRPVSAQWKLVEDGGSTCELALEDVEVDEIPRNNSTLIIEGMHDSGGGTGDLEKICEMQVKVKEEPDPMVPGLYKVRLLGRDWFGGRLRRRLMIAFGDFLLWKLHDAINYIFRDRFAIPSANISLPSINPKLGVTDLDKVNFSARLDAVGAAQEIAKMLEWKVRITWPDEKIEWYHPKAKSNPTIWLDDKSTNELDQIFALEREIDPDDIVTDAYVEGKDEFGFPRVGEASDPSFVHDEDRLGFTGAVQEYADEIDTPENPAYAAQQKVGFANKTLGVSWEGLARNIFPGAVAEVVSVQKTNLKRGDRFKIVELEVRIPDAESDATMTALGVQYVH